MLTNMKTCSICGQMFDISFYTNYAYRKSVHGKMNFYCCYTCMRIAEKQLEAEEKTKKANSNDN